MDKTIAAFGLILIGAVLQVNSLQCYVCDYCASVTENHLQNCSDSSSGTTQNPSVTITTQNTNNPGTTGPATNAPTNATTSAPTNAPTNATTAAPSDLDDIEVGKLYDDYDDYFKFIRADNVTHICWKDSKTVNGTTTVSRGCGTAKTCEANQLGASCLICEGDKCNTASSLPVSALLLVSVSFFSFFLRE